MTPERTHLQRAVPWVRATLRVVLGLLFLAAGFLKFGAREAFFASLMQYQLVDANTAYAAAGWLPVVEMIVGLGLLINFPRAVWPLCGAALLLVFTAAMVAAMVRGLEIDCACLGPLEIGGGYPVWLARNVLLIAALVWMGLGKAPRHAEAGMRKKEGGSG